MPRNAFAGTNFSPDRRHRGLRFQKLPTPDTFKYRPATSLFSRGPSVVGVGRPDVPIGGPGDTPPEYASDSEWYFGWACGKLLGPEGQVWERQINLNGGRHVPGGAVIDFILTFNPSNPIGVRIQSFLHRAGPWGDPSEVQAFDAASFTRIAEQMQVIDVFDQYYIGDPTGDSAIQMVKDTIMGIEHPDPLVTGMTWDV